MFSNTRPSGLCIVKLSVINSLNISNSRSVARHPSQVRARAYGPPGDVAKLNFCETFAEQEVGHSVSRCNISINRFRISSFSG